jgi:PAS domain S-box-containing protein
MMRDESIQFSNLAEALIDQSPDAMVFADTAGIIRLWNPAAQRIFGFSESVAVGASMNIIIPERFREAHWRGYRRAIVERTTKYQGQLLSTRSVRSDGTLIYVELSFAIIRNPKSEVMGVLAHARDITKRFERERGGQ